MPILLDREKSPGEEEEGGEGVFTEFVPSTFYDLVNITKIAVLKVYL